MYLSVGLDTICLLSNVNRGNEKCPIEANSHSSVIADKGDESG